MCAGSRCQTRRQRLLSESASVTTSLLRTSWSFATRSVARLTAQRSDVDTSAHGPCRDEGVALARFASHLRLHACRERHRPRDDQGCDGHADLKTTERYLHARSEAEMAARFTQAFSPRPRSRSEPDKRSRIPSDRTSIAPVTPGLATAFVVKHSRPALQRPTSASVEPRDRATPAAGMIAASPKLSGGLNPSEGR